MENVGSGIRLTSADIFFESGSGQAGWAVFLGLIRFCTYIAGLGWVQVSLTSPETRVESGLGQAHFPLEHGSGRVRVRVSLTSPETWVGSSRFFGSGQNLPPLIFPSASGIYAFTHLPNQ